MHPRSVIAYCLRNKTEHGFDERVLVEPVPTATKVGSVERVEVYAARVQNGEHVFCDGDSVEMTQVNLLKPTGITGVRHYTIRNVCGLGVWMQSGVPELWGDR